LYVSDLRGGHGTGILQGATYSNYKRYLMHKSVSDASYFIWYHTKSNQGNKDLMDGVSNNFFIGHVRYATKGEVNDQNAHPFEFSKIIGVHNGTLKDKKYESKEKTDSEMFFKDINERGILPVLQELDKESAYAIIVYDKKNGHISLARNDKRPMWVCVHNKRRVMYLASEFQFLEMCASRRDFDISDTMYIEPGVIHTFNPLNVKAKDIPDWKLTTVKKPEEKEVNLLRVEEKELLKLPPPTKENLTELMFQDNSERKILEFPTEALRQKSKDERAFGRYRIIGSKFTKKCISCQKKMDLYQQYIGTEVTTGVYSCKECDDLSEELAKELAKGVQVH
jgi:predicted glutamine amidotransferase